MARKLKEEEKIEKAIRGLLKLPENRRCINCNSMGPQYVCTTFWTFICTNCSGIHREFTHRVKSVSMAKFTTDEVGALQAGGNERARQVYFKEWDPYRNSQPDGSNPYKLRDFIKHVYVDRKFTGEKGTEKLPRLRLADKEDSSGVRRPSSSRIGLSSPSYEDRHDQRYNSARSSPGGRSDDGVVRYYYDESRSPRYTQQSSRSAGGYRRSPVRFEVVDDRFRDDGHGSRRRSSNASRLTSEDFKAAVGRSPDDLQKSAEKPSISLEARLESELLWKSSQPTRSQGKEAQGPSNVQKVASSPRQSTSNNGNKAKGEKVANVDSSIDNYDDSKPPLGVQTQPIPPSTTTSALTTAANDGTDWVPFVPLADEKRAQTRPPYPNTLEFLLFELSGPAALPGPSDNEGSSGIDQFQYTAEQSAAPTTELLALEAPPGLTQPETVDVPRTESRPSASIQQPVEEASGIALDDGADSMQSPISQHYDQSPTSAPAENESSMEQPFSTAPSPSLETKIQQQQQQHPSAPYPSQIIARAEPETISLPAPTSPQLEARPSGRKEIPEDLFTMLYSQAPAPIRSEWQPAPPQGFGFNMQYYPSHTMQLGAYSNSPKSTNPFDVGDEGTEFQVPSFTSMPYLQEARFNNVPAPSSPFSLGLHSSYVPSMQQPQSPSQRQPFSPGGVYMGQQQGWSEVPFSSLQQQQQGLECFGGNVNHQMMMMGYPGTNGMDYSFSSSSSPSMGGGNPFG